MVSVHLYSEACIGQEENARLLQTISFFEQWLYHDDRPRDPVEVIGEDESLGLGDKMR